MLHKITAFIESKSVKIIEIIYFQSHTFNSFFFFGIEGFSRIANVVSTIDS